MSTLPPVEHSAICPYCGQAVHPDAPRCDKCTGLLDEFNRRLMQQHLGPWYLHKPHMAFRPGFSYSVLKDMVRRGAIEADSVVRGPTTRQYWAYAKDTPGVAHLLGMCHACGQWVQPMDKTCPHCSRPFPNPDHRNYLGLDPDNHKLVAEAIERERRRHAPAEPAGRGKDRPLVPPDNKGRSSETNGDSLFELASATTGFRQAPKQNPVPRSVKRGGPLLWTLLGVSLSLLILLLILVLIALFGGGTIDIFAAPEPAAAWQIPATAPTAAPPASLT